MVTMMTKGRCRRAWHAFVYVGVGLCVWLGGLALAQQSPPPGPDPAAIPLVDLPGRAEEAEKLLKEAETRATVPSEVQAIEARIPETAARLKEGLASIQERLQAGLPLAQLELVTREWRGIRAEIAAELATLAKQAGQLDRDLDQIRGVRSEWERAREDARKGKAPRSLLDRIELILVRARTVQGELESRRANLLILQGRVSQGQRLCDDLLDRLADAKRERVDELNVKDAPPVWSPRLWAGVWNELSSGTGGLVAGIGEALRTALFRSDWRPTIHLLLLGVLLIVFARVRRMARAWSDAERPAILSSSILERPISVGAGPVVAALPGDLSPGILGCAVPGQHPHRRARHASGHIRRAHRDEDQPVRLRRALHGGSRARAPAGHPVPGPGDLPGGDDCGGTACRLALPDLPCGRPRDRTRQRHLPAGPGNHVPVGLPRHGLRRAGRGPGVHGPGPTRRHGRARELLCRIGDRCRHPHCQGTHLLCAPPLAATPTGIGRQPSRPSGGVGR